MPGEITHEERNRIILRRTLSAASWLFAAFGALTGLMALSVDRAKPAFDPRLLLLHAAALAAAGAALWRPRRGAWLLVLLAAAGSAAFAALDLRAPNVPAALADGAYPALALAVFLKTRGELDPRSGEG